MSQICNNSGSPVATNLHRVPTRKAEKMSYESRRGGSGSILLKGMRVYLAQFYR